jgi:GTPase
MDELKKLLKHKLLNKLPIEISEKTAENEQIKVAELMAYGNICPIFSVSSVNKFGIDILVKFIWRIDKLKTFSI